MSVCRQAEEAESRRRRRRWRRRGLEGVRDPGVSRAKRVVNRMQREKRGSGGGKEATGVVERLGG